MSPYENLPRRNFWKTGVAQLPFTEISDLYAKKFDITADMEIATAGSCFAQHIKRHLSANRFKVLDYEPGPLGLTPERQAAYGFGLFSARYGNIYTVRQLLQLTKEALGLLQPAHAIWKKGDRFVDGLRPTVEPAGFAEPRIVLIHRLNHLVKVRAMLERMSLMIFTLGLTEAWIGEDDGMVYPTSPGTVAAPVDAAANFQFKNFTTAETISDFLEFRGLVQNINPGCRFLLTVSPVPLTATASSEHVLVATTYSKSVLRAAAGELAATLNDVDYFPSYELVSSPPSKAMFFEANLRSVSAAGVKFVMDRFFAVHQPYVSESDAAGGYPDARLDEVCEDALLEAFLK